MRIQVTPTLPYIILPVTVLFTALPSLAQHITNADSLSKNTFGWNQEEKEFGFAHFDEVFKTNEVSKGSKVHKLPQGTAIAAFSKGGQKEKELDAFITGQKVAGILILQDGKIRLERYALGFSDAGKWTSQSVAKSVTVRRLVLLSKMDGAARLDTNSVSFTWLDDNTLQIDYDKKLRTFY